MAGDDYDELYGDLYGDVDPSSTSSAAAATTSTPAPAPATSTGSTATTVDPRGRPQGLPPNPVVPSAPAAGVGSVGAGGNPPPMRFDAPPQAQQQGGGGQGGGMGQRTKPNDMPEAGKMFIGGLNWDTTDDSLKSYFEQFGTVTHCTIMRDSESGRSRGFAFLTFEDPTSVNVVMAREHYLDGKTIDPKRAIPRSEGAKTDKLFIRAIPPTCTPDAFRAYWRRWGAITDATLMMDKESGRHRGFGFVNYEDSETVQRVLEGGPHVMEGQVLEVKRAQTKQEQNRSFNQSYQPGSSSSGGGGGYNNNNNNQNNSNNPNNMMGGFDPQAMAKFFQQMAASGMNPFMMAGGGMGMPGMGMPGMGGMQGMGGMGMIGGMPGMGGMPGYGMMQGYGAPQNQGMDYYGGASSPMGQQGMTAQSGGGGDEGEGGEEGENGGSAWTAPMAQQGGAGRGRGGSSSRGGGGGRGGFNPPTGPASMRGAEETGAGGAGPTRNRQAGAGYHPYSR